MHRVVALRAIRCDRLRFGGLGLTGAVVRPHAHLVFARLCPGPSIPPLSPRVVGRHISQFALAPLPLVERHLDLRDAAMHGPCQTGDVDRTGGVSREDFLLMLSGVAQKSGREISVLETRGAAPDHPVSATCLETEYLKCAICVLR